MDRWGYERGNGKFQLSMKGVIEKMDFSFNQTLPKTPFFRRTLFPSRNWLCPGGGEGHKKVNIRTSLFSDNKEPLDHMNSTRCVLSIFYIFMVFVGSAYDCNLRAYVLSVDYEKPIEGVIIIMISGFRT